jgi:hypothetical protein
MSEPFNSPDGAAKGATMHRFLMGMVLGCIHREGRDNPSEETKAIGKAALDVLIKTLRVLVETRDVQVLRDVQIADDLGNALINQYVSQLLILYLANLARHNLPTEPVLSAIGKRYGARESFSFVKHEIKPEHEAMLDRAVTLILAGCREDDLVYLLVLLHMAGLRPAHPALEAAMALYAVLPRSSSALFAAYCRMHLLGMHVRLTDEVTLSYVKPICQDAAAALKVDECPYLWFPFEHLAKLRQCMPEPKLLDDALTEALQSVPHARAVAPLTFYGLSVTEDMRAWAERQARANKYSKELDTFQRRMIRKASGQRMKYKQKQLTAAQFQEHQEALDFFMNY